MELNHTEVELINVDVSIIRVYLGVRIQDPLLQKKKQTNKPPPPPIPPPLW